MKQKDSFNLTLGDSRYYSYNGSVALCGEFVSRCCRKRPKRITVKLSVERPRGKGWRKVKRIHLLGVLIGRKQYFIYSFMLYRISNLALGEDKTFWFKIVAKR